MLKLLAAVMVSGLALVGCTRAEAMPLGIQLGYMDNGTLDKDGAVISAGTEYNNVRVGATTFLTEDKVETYGIYAAAPLNIHNTKVSVVPTIQVDKYRDSNETVGSVGLGLEYALTTKYRVGALAMTSRSLSGNSDEMRGENYSVGITRSF